MKLVLEKEQENLRSTFQMAYWCDAVVVHLRPTVFNKTSKPDLTFQLEVHNYTTGVPFTAFKVYC